MATKAQIAKLAELVAADDGIAEAVAAAVERATESNPDLADAAEDVYGWNLELLAD